MFRMKAYPRILRNETRVMTLNRPRVHADFTVQRFRADANNAGVPVMAAQMIWMSG
jgi:hypothetical protein